MKTRPKTAKKPKWTGKPATTMEGNLIKALMVEQQTKGDFRDFVIISGARITDANGSYNVKTMDGKPIHVDVVALVAKRELHRFLGPAADAFWNRKLSRRVQMPPPAETTLEAGKEVELC